MGIENERRAREDPRELRRWARPECGARRAAVRPSLRHGGGQSAKGAERPVSRFEIYYRDTDDQEAKNEGKTDDDRTST